MEMKKRRSKCKQEKCRKAFKFRAYPNRELQNRMFDMMRVNTIAYNGCVGEYDVAYGSFRRKIAEFKKSGAGWDSLDEKRREKLVKEAIKSVDWPTRSKLYGNYVSKRNNPQNDGFYIAAIQNTMLQVFNAVHGYQSKRDKGDPDVRRPKKQDFHRGIIYRQSGFFPKKAVKNKVRLSGIGTIKFKRHREIEGRIKAVIVKFEHGKWYVIFSCESPVKKRKRTGKKVTIKFSDLYFIEDSSGRIIEQPGYYFGSLPKIRELSRAYSKKSLQYKDGDYKKLVVDAEKDFKKKNLKKAKRKLGKFHGKIKGRRRDFINKIVRNYVMEYDIITVYEQPFYLRQQCQLSSRDAIRLADAAPGIFLRMLKHKCNEYGVKLILIKNELLWDAGRQITADKKSIKQQKQFLRNVKRRMK